VAQVEEIQIRIATELSHLFWEKRVVESSKNNPAPEAREPIKSIVAKAPIQLRLLFGSFASTSAIAFGLVKTLDVIKYDYKLFAIAGTPFPGWSILLILMLAVTFLTYFFFDLLFRRPIQWRDGPDCLDKCVYVVRGERRVFSELYESASSVVRTAKRELCVTGSRSRDSAYLSAIEGLIASNPDLIHTRVLIGPSRNIELDEHIERLSKMAKGFDRTHGSGRIRVTELPIDRTYAERFIVASETRAVIALPSFSSALGYDAALVIEDDRASQQLCAIIRSMADSSPKKIIWRQGGSENEVA
jgi:Arc/MetJ-type ribon-helix-helix transcriptional regulator